VEVREPLAQGSSARVAVLCSPVPFSSYFEFATIKFSIGQDMWKGTDDEVIE